MFTDTHTHPYLADDPHGFVRAAIKANVKHLIIPNVDTSSVNGMYELQDAFPDNVFLAMGLHPTEVGANAAADWEYIRSQFNTGRKFVAVGEIGMDLYWDTSMRDAQMEYFDIQLATAEKLKLPVIIHCREALDETLEVLKGHAGVAAVFHSFGGTADDVERIRRAGEYYFGINGIVTFKNSTLRTVLPSIPLDRLLLETDSPYLTPVPYRGKPNQSAYIPYIAAEVAKALTLDVPQVAAVTTSNAKEFFGF